MSLIFINNQSNSSVISWCLKMLHTATQWLILLLLKTIGLRVHFCFSCASFLPQSGGLETLNCLEVWMDVSTVVWKPVMTFLLDWCMLGESTASCDPEKKLMGVEKKKRIKGNAYFPHAAHWNCPVIEVIDEVIDAVILLSLYSHIFLWVLCIQSQHIRTATGQASHQCHRPNLPLMSPSITSLSSAYTFWGNNYNWQGQTLCSWENCADCAPVLHSAFIFGS